MTLLRRHAACAVLALVAAVFYGVWTWSDQLASLGGDSAVYVLVARDFAPYLPPDPVASGMAAHSQFPPLYSLLLVASGGAASVPVAHAATTLALVAALVALYAWLLALGLGRGTAVAGAALFALLPGTYLQSLQLHSESLYLALSLATLLFLARAERGDARALGFAALALALALLARTAGIALVVAFALGVLRRPSRRGAALLLLAILPAAIWAVLHRPEFSYSDGLLQHYRGASPIAIVQRFFVSAQIMGWALVENFVQTATLARPVAGLGLFALAVAAVRFLRLRADAWYLFAYLGMVTVWPYPAEAVRFGWVVVPMLIGNLFLGAAWLGARVAAAPVAGRAVAWAPALLLALIAAPQFALACQRFGDAADEGNRALRHLPEWYAPDRQVARAQALLHLELAAAIRELGAQVPADACVFSIKPALVAYYGNRESNVPPPENVDDATFDAAVARKGCRHFLLLGAASPSFSVPLYPLDRMQDRLAIVDVRESRRDDSGRVVAALAVLPD